MLACALDFTAIISLNLPTNYAGVDSQLRYIAEESKAREVKRLPRGHTARK